MKRVRRLLLLLFAVMLLTGCHDKPKNLPQDVYDAGVAASDAIDNYLSGKMSLDDMRAILDQSHNTVLKIIMPEDLPLSEQIASINISSCFTKIDLVVPDLIIAEVTHNYGDSKDRLKKANKELKRALNK